MLQKYKKLRFTFANKLMIYYYLKDFLLLLHLKTYGVRVVIVLQAAR
jgi:hypothetical protein